MGNSAHTAIDLPSGDTRSEGGINGGIMTPQEGPWPGNMAFYIDVEDLESYNRKITEAGGKVIVERMDVPGVGAMALFEDPDGRVLGIWQQLSRTPQDA
jgi:uncharacterized protein